MRRIGRLRKPCEPSITTDLLHAANAPANNRIVVPELPQSIRVEEPPLSPDKPDKPRPPTEREVPSKAQGTPKTVNASSMAPVTPDTRKLSM
jgi:hypothetical protein